MNVVFSQNNATTDGATNSYNNSFTIGQAMTVEIPVASFVNLIVESNVMR